MTNSIIGKRVVGLSQWMAPLRLPPFNCMGNKFWQRTFRFGCNLSVYLLKPSKLFVRGGYQNTFWAGKDQPSCRDAINIKILYENHHIETEEIPLTIMSKNRCQKQIFNKPEQIFLSAKQSRALITQNGLMKKWWREVSCYIPIDICLLLVFV